MSELERWLGHGDAERAEPARDGREALELARQDPPDLILVGKVMPEVDGPAVARELKREANERMQRLVQRDEKTELFNYRHFMDRLSEQFKMARRDGSNLTVVMNDHHGHVAGDRVLRQFAQIMSRTARETDLVARYGGGEFTVLLPSTSAALGQRLAERVRMATEGFSFDVANGGGPARITVSAGVATFPINDKLAEPPDLVEAADHALYRARDMGRNRSRVDERSRVALL